MILKKMDSKQEEIVELTALLKGKLIPYQRSLIERELKAIRSGVSGQRHRVRSCNHTFHRTRQGVLYKKVGPDFPGETFSVLKEKEEKEYGECHTHRLVLETWDKLETY
jgi:hypothetical protein